MERNHNYKGDISIDIYRKLDDVEIEVIEKTLHKAMEKTLAKLFADSPCDVSGVEINIS